MIVDFDLATLSAAELRRARTCAGALAHFGVTKDAPSIARVALSLVESLDAEIAAREAGRGRGTVRLTVDNFADADPEASYRSRARAVGYLQLVRDDHDELPAVRHLFASVMADLEDPTPTTRYVEIARLEGLSNRTYGLESR